MNDDSYLILRCAGQLLVLAPEGQQVRFPTCAEVEAGDPADCLEVDSWNGRPCRARDVTALPALPGGQGVPLRALFTLAGPALFSLAGRASQLLDWRAQHRFCGRCGTGTAPLAGEFAMACPACGLLAYPRISPAVMVLIRDGRRLLLARSPHFKPGVYSALAGFVEAGETLEQCAVREVREEVGLEIANLRYFASQPWPFPHSLMVAFFADYAGGQIRPEPGEIEAADWFLPEALPLLPDPVSISRHLIEAALAQDT